MSNRRLKLYNILMEISIVMVVGLTLVIIFDIVYGSLPAAANALRKGHTTNTR